MQGPTHRRGGELAALLGSVIMIRQGMMIDNVHPIAQFLVMYPFAQYGAKCSDLDHHRGSIPFQDSLSVAIHKVLHLTSKPRAYTKKGSLPHKLLGVLDSKHRSWQTHSADLTFGGVLLATLALTGIGVDHLSNQEVILRLIGLGLSLGILAHIVLDMLTPEGCWVALLLGIETLFGVKVAKKKFSLVPNRHYFATGGPWENVVNRIMTWMCSILLIWLGVEVFYGDPWGEVILPSVDYLVKTFWS